MLPLPIRHFVGLDSGRETVANHCASKTKGKIKMRISASDAAARLSTRVRANLRIRANRAGHRRSRVGNARRQSSYRRRWCRHVRHHHRQSTLLRRPRAHIGTYTVTFPAAGQLGPVRALQRRPGRRQRRQLVFRQRLRRKSARDRRVGAAERSRHRLHQSRRHRAQWRRCRQQRLQVGEDHGQRRARPPGWCLPARSRRSSSGDRAKTACASTSSRSAARASATR